MTEIKRKGRPYKDKYQRLVDKAISDCVDILTMGSYVDCGKPLDERFDAGQGYYAVSYVEAEREMSNSNACEGTDFWKQKKKSYEKELLILRYGDEDSIPLGRPPLSPYIVFVRKKYALADSHRALNEHEIRNGVPVTNFKDITKIALQKKPDVSAQWINILGMS